MGPGRIIEEDPMRLSFRSSILFVAILALSALPASADQTCASGHMRARLDVFSEGSVSLPLYWSVENGGQVAFTVRIIGSGCDGSTSTIEYDVQDGTATTPADYTHVSQPITFVNTVGHPDSESRNVNITDDAFPLDGAAEFATVELIDASGGSLIPPTSAPIVIVDEDGPAARFSMVEGAYEESETSASGGVPVFRGGAATQAATIDYSLTPGSAGSGSDYQGAASGTLTFQPGDRMELIPITIIDDAVRERSETLEVSISGTGAEGTTKVPFRIIDNEESFPPSSSLHHPNQGKRYPPSKFLIREIHIFTEDQGGAGVVAAEFALRRNMKDRSCGWWTGRKFRKGKCDVERWLNTAEYETDFFFVRLKELPPSIGPVRNYTAYSRAIDGARNVEEDFEVGRNANTFEIKKPR